MKIINIIIGFTILTAATIASQDSFASSCLKPFTQNHGWFVHNNCGSTVTIRVYDNGEDSGLVNSPNGHDTILHVLDTHQVKITFCYGFGCDPEGDETHNNRIYPSVASGAKSNWHAAKMNESFCNLFHDDFAQNNCHTACALSGSRQDGVSSAKACVLMRKLLTQYQGTGDADYPTSAVRHTAQSGGQRHSCDRGQIWSSATTGYYRCECPPGEYLDQGGPCQ
jgi:hypothetical protein